MKKAYIFRIFSLVSLVLPLVYLVSCTEESPLIPDTELVVVQAYLYANEPVDDVRLTSTVPLDADTLDPEPINDAQVTLWKDDQPYALVASAGDSGYYHYPGNDLEISTGDHFSLEIRYLDQTITAETSVPAPPESLEISADTLIAGFGGGFFPGEGFDENRRATVSWKNEEGDLFYMVIQNAETDPQPVESEFQWFRPFRFISRPTRSDSLMVQTMELTHLGRHKVVIYRVNQEYADLYEQRTQDSRDLNEPPTNIRNGLGVFSAFNSDSVFFYLKNE